LSQPKKASPQPPLAPTSAPRSKRSLTGLRVLVGRARHQASALSAGLKALGAEVIDIPLIEIRPPRSFAPLDSALHELTKYQWLVLTSVNGVDALAARIEQLGLNPQSLKHLKIAGIGPSTSARIEKLGLHVSVVPRRYIAESVVDSLRDKVKGVRVLLVRARVARDVIPRELEKAGARVDTVEAYETVVPQSSRARLRLLMGDWNERPHVITFTSSSTVRNFVALVGGRTSAGNRKKSSWRRSMRGIRLASIGPITSATLAEFGLRANIEAKDYTIDGLIRAIEFKAEEFAQELYAPPHR
jgi:uroporphyrinogen-III synthase